MIQKVYIEPSSGTIATGEPPDMLFNWVLVGRVGDGRNGDPFGMLPANVCTTCGVDRVLTASGYWACPRGHAQLSASPTWGVGPGLLLAPAEAIQPLPFPYSNSGAPVTTTGATACIPARAVDRIDRRGRVTVVTDCWVPVDSAAAWRPAIQWSDAATTVELRGDSDGLAQATVVFRTLPAEPLPVATPFTNFGHIIVDVPVQLRLDWLERR